MKRDTLFEKNTSVDTGSFSFDKDVAEVFDDMAQRSIPGYKQQQQYIVQSILNLIQKNKATQTCIIDFGCSTGETFFLLSEQLKNRSWEAGSVHLYACDYSNDMLSECNMKLSPYKDIWEEIHIIQLDLKDTHTFLQKLCKNTRDVAAINLHFVLQFIPISLRAGVITLCWESIVEGGKLFIGEKLCYDDARQQSESEKMQYEFKRSQGYSNIEIEGKRKALEGVLLPQSYKEFFSMIGTMPHAKIETYYRQGEFVCVEIEKLPV